ncbi:RNA polymerase sigma-B factor [Nocardia transvalensis]|uniref:RNA polymerase sigma-B factor n=1 Tax=Nocardia transvalensis TaxID=37333 RepID=A0A7W9PFU9_9NOCA|nr:SigB/SigF/SigG family RNA polymerase sigma factor [Nocardia transvalensis]MBB5915367.1 RNA polymerase sigma-B factor [Nocardia transvalensis]
MTRTAEPPAAPAVSSRSRRGHDSYDGIEPEFERLADLDPGDARYPRLRDEIVMRCLPLAEHIARRFAGRGLDYDDLLQVAREGLLGAVDRFDPHRGPTFVAFAVPTVMGTVRRYFRDQGWTLHVPRGTKDLQQRIAAITPDLAQRLARTPDTRDLADALDVETDQIAQALTASNCYRTRSLDCPAEPGNDPAVTVGDTCGGPEPCYRLLEDAITVRPLIEALPEQDRAVLIQRFFAGRTQADIGAELGVSQMQVHRILTRTLNTLREQALDDTSPAPERCVRHTPCAPATSGAAGIRPRGPADGSRPMSADR